MSNDRSDKGPQQHDLPRRAGIERRDLLLGGTALLTATALSGVANAQAQTPDSIKTRTGRSRFTTTRLAPCFRHHSAFRVPEARRTVRLLPSPTPTAPRQSISAQPGQPMQRMATGSRPCPARAGSRSFVSIARAKEWRLSEIELVK